MQDKKYDIFISHASEDKDYIVRPLAILFERLGVRVWYDEFSLKLGDSLTAAIDKGLQESKYGLLILSKSFLRKNWPDYEYRSLMTREIDGERVILPLWYDVTKEDIKGYSLYLADIKALPISLHNYRIIIPSILRVVRPDIWQEMRMRGVLRKAVAESASKVVDISEIKQSTSKQSKLTKQQLVRSKAVYYGIGRHLNKTFDDYVSEYELDIVPERELQTWEIMNACYLEMIDRHPQASLGELKEYFRILIDISFGGHHLLNNAMTVELIELWKENYYEF